MFSVLYLVFSKFARFDIAHYPLYLLLGIILWNFFVEGTTSSISSLIGKAGLIKIINFPRSAIIVSSTFVAFFNFFLNFIIFVAFLFFSGETLPPGTFLLLIPVFSLYCLSLGMGFLLVALYARFKDIAHIWELLLQVGFWFTPIIYSIDMVPTRYHIFVFANPMAHIINSARDIIISGRVLTISEAALLLGISTPILIFGYLIFKRQEPYFAEEL